MGTIFMVVGFIVCLPIMIKLGILVLALIAGLFAWLVSLLGPILGKVFQAALSLFLLLICCAGLSMCCEALDHFN